MIRTISVITILLTFCATLALAQTERKAVRKGNKEFKKGEFIDAEISYRSALDLNPKSFKGNFNLGSALYKQDKFEESASMYADLANTEATADNLAKVYHNLGNSYFNQQKFEESVEAYKNALRQNPSDMQTKYNLAQAQRMLQQQQQQQQQQNQDKNNDSESDDSKDKQDENKDQQNKDQDKNQQNEQNKDKKEQQQQPREQQISPQDAQRMLEAIRNNEQKVQERVQKEKAKQAKVKVEKNW